MWAIARCRCPRCLSGRVWQGMFSMNEPCPVCGLRFERETGYWTGAMVASYALGIPVLALLVLAVWLATEGLRDMGAQRGNVLGPRLCPDRDGALDPVRVSPVADRPCR